MDEIPESLKSAIDQAERILVGRSEEDIKVAAGKPFLIDIERSLRGAGARGTRARILNSGDQKSAPQYRAKQLYTFLLVKGPGGRGWANSGTGILEVNRGKVRWLNGNEKPFELTSDRLDELIDAAGTDAGMNIPQRESLEGRWLVYVSDRGSDAVTWLIEFKRDAEGRYSPLAIESSLPESEIKTTTIEAEKIAIDMVAKGIPFEFTGRFVDGRVRGLMRSGAGGIAASWMVPTELTTLDGLREPKPTMAVEEVTEAQTMNSPLAELLRFVRRRRDLPVTLDAYLMLLPMAAAEIKTEAEFRAVIASYRDSAMKWGPEMAVRVEVDVALACARAGTFPEIGIECVQRAQEAFNEKTPPHWVAIVKRIRGQLLIAAGRESEGIEHLRSVRKDSHFDPEITWLLIQHAQKNDQFEEALEMLGELIALPGLEGAIVSVNARNELALGKAPPPQVIPSRIAEKIWRRLKKPDDELASFFDEVFEKKMRELAGPRRPARGPDDGNRVALLELFTGAQCPPCVGIDIATTAFEFAYAPTEAIVLRYHQHTPGPDPFANPDTAERFHQYGGEGTPTLMINGREFRGVGGSLNISEELLTRLHELVTPILKEKVQFQIDVSATQRGERVEITAKATGTEPFPDHIHLRMALAEQKIYFLAKNGVRVHDMVVRGLPGGTRGVPPKKGKLEYEESLDLVSHRNKIATHLDQVERETKEKFEVKPTELKDLVVVGWLQNEETGEILQAVSTPVKVIKATNSPQSTNPAK